MPKITICIDVSDLDQATTFYCEGLGCKLVTERDTHNTLDAEGTTLQLCLKEQGTHATGKDGPTRDYSRHWTPVHLDFDVDNVERVAQQVRKLGGKVEQTKSGDWGAAAFCADPFGNGFCLLKLPA